MSTAPTGSPDRVSGGPDGQPELADRLAELTRAVPGVADLHGGVFGEVATYLPGRKVAGVRVEDDHVEIHVSVLYDQPVRATAEAVAARLEPVAGRPVHVTVDDVLLPSEVAREDDPASRPDTAGTDDTVGPDVIGPTSDTSTASTTPQSSKETSS